MNRFGAAIRKGGRRPGQLRWTRRIAAVVGFTLLPGLLTPVAFADDPDPLGRPKLPAHRADKVVPFPEKVNKKTAAVLKKAAAADRAATKRAAKDQARSVTWPKAGKAQLTLPATGTAKATPGALPVTLSPGAKVAKGKRQAPAAGSATVQVLDQEQAAKLGVKGLVLTVTGPARGGSAEIGVDYSAFASAYGGDWAGRLKLQRLPNCALSNPGAAKCRTRTPLDFINHRRDERLTAPVAFTTAARTPATAGAPAGAKAAGPAGQTMVLALAAGDSSASGDFKATPLAASSTWEAGGSSGSFTWSYPLRVPPSAAGPKPDLSISYDSGSVDGRTASTNNQGTVIGEGFDLTSSYIERKYGSCEDDGQDDKFDLCWKYENASLVLNGKATELVKDDTSGVWRLKNDDASTVTHSTGADNGDDNGEHWTVTTGDGTKYVFGLNKLDGAAATDRTQSVWTVPVFGDDAGEPGYADGTSFSGRDKQQAWRWNLDYVVDTHDNAMTYWYEAEENNYDKLGDDTTGTAYTRGGYLKEVRYGQRAGALFSATPAASNKVTFGYVERCVAAAPGCSSLNEDTRDNWPDVPLDAVCNTGDKCTGNVGPSFFTRKRMTGVITHAWDAAATTPAYAEVDTWALKQTYLDPGDTGDSTDQSLWLDEIRHTGNRGTALTLDPVTFYHEFLANRVDSGSDNILPFYKPRLVAVTSETGAETTISYLPQDCVAGQTMPRADENTRRCYPVWWSPNGGPDPILDWFHKYPVMAVVTDPKGGSEAVEHTYQYEGGGAWHYNNDPMTKEKERTWSLWRGFGRVTHFTGAGRDGKPRSKTVTIYLRGMNGDRVLTPDGTALDPDRRKTVTVGGILAGTATDLDPFAGFTRETVVYNGDVPVSDTVNSAWTKRTAIQHKSYADTEAYFVRVSAVNARTNLNTTGTPSWRLRTTTTTFDDYGMPVTVWDSGDKATISGDETCTRTWYARNDIVGINNLVSRTRVTSNLKTAPVADPCTITDANLDLPSNSTTPGNVISDTAIAYDSTTWTETQQPTKGEVKWTGRAQAYTTADAPVWQKTSTTAYDTLGRPTTVKDTNDTVTATTTYAPVATGPLTSMTLENANLHKTTTLVNFATGAPTKVTDPNGNVTETEYDALGRTTKVWLPNRDRELGKTPNYVHAYSVTATDMPWVSTAALKGDASGYNTTYAIYDAQLRPRQVQTPSPSGGTVVALTLYDERGLAVSAQADIWAHDKAPSGTLVQTEGGAAPTQTDTTYDGASRPIKAVTKNYNVVRHTIDTTYSGGTVTTTAPAGGQATTIVTNALGQTTQRREYPGPQPTGTPTTTDYTYTPAGQPDTITGPDQTKWSYGYDLFGRQTSATDPDKGKTTTAYNPLDQAISTTDSRTKTLLTEYDQLGRKTGLWDGTKTDTTKLAAWEYDTLAKGQADKAIRYVGGVTGKAFTSTITEYDPLYQATGSKLTLPADDPLVTAGVPQTLSFSTLYNLDGSVRQAGNPAVAGLASEIVGNEYNFKGVGLQLTASGTTGYLQGAGYSPLGDLTQLSLATDPTSTKKLYLSYQHEAGTRRLKNSFVTSDTHAYRLQDLQFRQDLAGNVTSIFDKSTLGGTGKTDNQCFTYDGHRRLTEAWTPRTADCVTTGRTTANLDGAAPYWSSYTYTAAGQRNTETTHATAGNTTTNYTYGTTTGQPHPLAKTVTGTTTKTYAYDKAGNTTTRPGTQATQTLTWNTEGELATTTEPVVGTKPALGTSYLYDAAGELLIRRPTTADGDTVLYLGATEVRLTKQGTTTTLSGTRYYTAAGQTIAVRTATKGTIGTKLNFLAADHHGTSSLAVDATTLAVTKRYTTPFGAPRGTKPTTWPDDKAFLGKPADTTTGLTHIGAREYDPAIGQFISVDPLLVPSSPQSLNGYSYANNTPVTSSDPTGMCAEVDCPAHGVTPLPDGSPHQQKPSSGDSVHADQGTADGSSQQEADENALMDLLPRTDDPDRLTQMWMNYYRVDGGDYWQSIVGDGDRTAIACYGRDACREAFAYLTNTGDVAGAKEIAATYCVRNSSKCAGAARDYRTTKAILELLPELAAASRGARLGRTCARCFLAGTDVLMADGTTKDIEKIELGDQVVATDPETGESGPRKVTALIITEDDKHFNKLSIATDDGVETLTATHEHPFWSPSEGRWVEARDLKSGTTLRTDDGNTVIVTANRAFSKHARTYNLTVDDLHTYYVLAGETPVLVHNSNCSPFTDGDIWDGSFDVGGQTVEAMATVRAAGDTVHLDGLMVFPKGTQGLSRAPIGPDAIRQMKSSIAEQARSQGYSTVVLNYERHIPKPDGSIYKRPGSMTLDVAKILGD
ncbi:polymorphic toxin-type HINT domain-containing protein [Streptomyces sp. NPDC051219]|uniref:polymorphic toxin-type HINT domain-containing protein n=1 Tax=Streptomyces sp. NPDC051219 TaxID=3155283 RepID=UPI003447C8B0